MGFSGQHNGLILYVINIKKVALRVLLDTTAVEACVIQFCKDVFVYLIEISDILGVHLIALG